MTKDGAHYLVFLDSDHYRQLFDSGADIQESESMYSSKDTLTLYNFEYRDEEIKRLCNSGKPGTVKLYHKGNMLYFVCKAPGIGFEEIDQSHIPGDIFERLMK